MVYIFNPSIWRQKLLTLYEFQAGLVSIASSRATWRDPVSETLKKKKKKDNNKNQLKIPTGSNETLTETKSASIFLSSWFVLGVILRLEGKERINIAKLRASRYLSVLASLWSGYTPIFQI